MPATDGFAEIEMAGFDVEDSIVIDVGRRRRRRRRRSNRQQHIPLDITNEADMINDINGSGPFTEWGNHSPTTFDSSVESWRIYSCNHNCNAAVVEETDLESGELEVKVNSSSNDEKRCRICHLKFHGGDREEDDDDVEEGTGDAIELGCNCKGDLGTAHQNCAVTWFLFKGNLACEICGATVQNVGLEEIEEAHNEGDVAEIDQSLESPIIEPVLENDQGESSMHLRRFVNILLIFMVLAFVISLFLRFKGPH